MTAEQLKTKYSELIENVQSSLAGYLKRAIRSGAVDLDGFPDNFVLPRIILCAALKESADQHRLDSPEFKTEVENIYTCV